LIFERDDSAYWLDQLRPAPGSFVPMGVVFPVGTRPERLPRRAGGHLRGHRPKVAYGGLPWPTASEPDDDR